MDFEFDFTCNKAMKEKVPDVSGALVSTRVSQILITALYTILTDICCHSQTDETSIRAGRGRSCTTFV